MQRTSVKNTTLYNYVLHGQLDELLKYCDNGANREKFYEIMTLGILDNSQRRPDEKGLTALNMAAKNGKVDIVTFIIQNALKDEKGKRLLADHLVLSDQGGKNTLHDSVCAKDHDPIIFLLCRAASALADNPPKPSNDSDKHLSHYVNIRDGERNFTALHYAARQCQFSNYDTLVRMGADENAKVDGKPAILFIAKNDKLKSTSFMQAYLQTPQGIHYFKQRHSYDLTKHKDASALAANKVSDDFLNTLIDIDLDTDLKDTRLAQLSAFVKTMTLIMKTPADKKPDFDILLGNLAAIDYAIIDPSDLPKDDKMSEEIKALQAAIKRAESLVPTSREAKDIEMCNEAKRAVITAELFLNLNNIPSCHREALTHLANSKLISAYPGHALDGLKKINADLLSDGEKFLLARRVVVAHATILLNHLLSQPIPKPGLLEGLFGGKNSVKVAIEIIEQLRKNLGSVDSINGINQLIESLPDVEHISKLKSELAREPILKSAPRVAAHRK